MATSAYIAKIKTDLRITTSALDTDLSDMIDQCFADLRLSGIINPNEVDKNILMAVKLYCRANFTDEPEKAKAYMERYESKKSVLMHAIGYGLQY